MRRSVATATLMTYLFTLGCGGGKVRTVPAERSSDLDVGDQVTLLLVDGSEITGEYGGRSRARQADYVARYESARQQMGGSVSLPELGPGAAITSSSGDIREGELVALSAEGVEILEDGRRTTSTHAWGEIGDLRSALGESVPVDALRELAEGGRLPSPFVLSVEVDDTTRQIALDQVESLTWKEGGSGVLLAVLGGAALVGIIAAAARPGPSPGLGSGSFSCPFVYSWDGERFRLDSETFGGAIFQAAQRTDTDVLEHLQPDRGVYRLLLTNELDEIQHVDHLELVVVDHPRGTRVVPAFGGQVGLISEPLAPSSARTLAGRDVTGLVAARDDSFWVSDPRGRRPGDPAAVRDGLILEFPRPLGATQAQLALRVQNTMWASFLQGYMLTLHGDDLDAWYAQMNSSPVARDMLRDVMIREGMLRVSLWDGTAWRDAGHVWEVGPSVAKDQLLTLDLAEFPGDVLRVRLDSSAGLWSIDSAEADYGPDPSFRSRTLLPSFARASESSDLLATLMREDGDRYTMPPYQGRAELRFAAPPREPDSERTVLLRSSGYYTIQMRGTGPARTALLARLMTLPGAFGSYSLELFNRGLLASLPGVPAPAGARSGERPAPVGAGPGR